MTTFADNSIANVENSAVGVVIMNLGTPDAPDAPSVRRFLRQFLSDPRVVEFPRLPWWFILNGIILVFRPSRSAKAYRKIWTDEGSPLMINTARQAEALQRRIGEKSVCVTRHAMRYGSPSVGEVFDELTGLGVQRIVVLPMYPQYSGSTIGSMFDEVGDALMKRRYVPSIRFVSGYAIRESYIESLAESVEAHWTQHGKAQRLLISFHGIPQDYVNKGDPYDSQCMATAQALAKRLNLDEKDWVVGFQSRVGAMPWLQPYVKDVIQQLADEGVSTVDALCPGFSVDCLETLEEMDIEYRNLFIDAGGQSFRYIPCLNDRPSHIEMMYEIVSETARDWLSPSE